MARLTELIERVERLTGPDREMDAEIDIALFGGETVWKTAQGTMESYPASRRPSKHHVGGFANEHVPLVTASLDAAIALTERVLPGRAAEILLDALRQWMVDNAPTSALYRYVLLATLKALAAREGAE